MLFRNRTSIEAVIISDRFFPSTVLLIDLGQHRVNLENLHVYFVMLNKIIKKVLGFEENGGFLVKQFITYQLKLQEL